MTGARAWNEQRSVNSIVSPDLRKAKLDGASLGGENLTGADLVVASLTSLGLSGANLSKAELIGAEPGRAIEIMTPLLVRSIWRRRTK